MKAMSIMIAMSSSVLAMSNSNLMMTWAFLEMNSISFVSFMKKSSEADNMMKYFLIQILGSIPLILTIALSMFFFINSFLESILLIIAMAIKMGAAPFHLWIVQMVKKMEWKSFFALLTIQKAAPIVILGLISKSFLLSLMIFFSSIFGAISIFLSNKMELIITFSSISHLSWMMMSEAMSKKSSMIYLSVYSFMIFIILINFYKDKIKNINSQEKMDKNSPMILSMLSLGGVPPTVGFFPKMMVIFLMIKNMKKSLMLSMVLLFSSMISVFMYMRTIMKTMTKAKKKSKFKKKDNLMLSHMNQIFFMPMIIMIFPM